MGINESSRLEMTTFLQWLDCGLDAVFGQQMLTYEDVKRGMLRTCISAYPVC
jgi:hypothetical protein